MYGPEGGVYSVTLPCKVSKLWPLLEGLLVERAVSAGEVSDFLSALIIIIITITIITIITIITTITTITITITVTITTTTTPTPH